MIESNYINGYEGAAAGLRLGGWQPSNVGANTALYTDLRRLQSRSRFLERSMAAITGSANTRKSEFVGTGITARWKHKTKNIKAKIQELWESQLDDIDYSGLSSLYGLQAIVASQVFISGEIFAKHISTGDRKNPYQIQLLESDFFPIDHTLISENGNKIIMAVEFHKGTSKRAAYWIYPDHPEDDLLGVAEIEPVRVPADQVAHIFDIRRPDQIRGVPETAPAIVPLYDYDMFQDAELKKLQISNLFAGVEEKDADAPPESSAGVVPGDGTIAEKIDQTDDDPDYSLEPGAILKPPAGVKMKFSDPPNVSGLDEWRRDVNRRISRGIGMTYEGFTGDYSQMSFSTIRAIFSAHRRYLMMRIKNEMIFQFCRPVAKNWLNLNIIAGNLPISAKTATAAWTPQAFEQVKPLEDARMMIMLERAGYWSHEKVQEMLGENYEDTLEGIISHNKTIDENGLVFDSDPRRVTGAGIVQPEAKKQ